MNGRVSKMIHDYAATYVHVARGSGRTMERIAKKNWNGATKKEKRAIENMMQKRIVQAAQRKG